MKSPKLFNILKFCEFLAIALEDAFPGRITVDYTQDPGTTGNFEVTLVETGQLLHSKARGQGKCQSREEKEAIIEKIQAYLDS